MNTQLPPGPRPPPQSRDHAVFLKVLFGVGLALFGAALLASNLGWFDMRQIVWRFWPTMLIVAGAAILLQRRHRSSLWGFVLLFWGLWIYADQLNWIRVNFWAVFGPTLLVLIGGSLIWRAVMAGTPEGRQAASDSYIRSFSLFAGSELRPQGVAFRGAELTAVMGGVKLDLSAAQLDGETPVIDVFAMMGGIEIYVPREWEVVNNVTAMMGACVDKRHPMPATATPGKRIIIRGTAVFGGIEIKD
jgi:predicted membrane protein